eukprot:2646944-Pyramimonas_sp.AAC.1
MARAGGARWPGAALAAALPGRATGSGRSSALALRARPPLFHASCSPPRLCAKFAVDSLQK